MYEVRVGNSLGFSPQVEENSPEDKENALLFSRRIEENSPLENTGDKGEEKRTCDSAGCR